MNLYKVYVKTENQWAGRRRHGKHYGIHPTTVTRLRERYSPAARGER